MGDTTTEVDAVSLVDLITKPAVTQCPLTKHWIVNSFGHRHQCGRGSAQHEEGFRRWLDAVGVASALGRRRLERAHARRGGSDVQ